jgi:hypothetical protein
VQEKVELLSEKSPERLERMALRIEKVLRIIPTDSRASYIITKIYESIQSEMGMENVDVESMVASLL